jgi:hypothetical protein
VRVRGNRGRIGRSRATGIVAGVEIRRGGRGTSRREAEELPMPDLDQTLRTLLGADPPQSVLALDDAARTELAEVIVAARRQQSHSLAEAFDATLKHVPFPVRAIVKRVLGG